jgi:eukaryotic-like serine/threonine-protein kinase
LALTPGTRLGVYEVIAQIGEGGMGQVFRAHDTKLNRDVALKVLPDSFASDSERLARFTREAQTLASLNHPHIAAIYGLEESGGVCALVMELVDGEDLSQRIARGAIPIDEALPVAKQIVEALEAAHEQGIIHRDLKPANIKMRPDGTVKVLDFGLAKYAPEPESAAAVHASRSATTTSPAMLTGVGMILGTAAYMSPEQARGKPADKRSELWAFGAVLYEMLTGRRAFAGDDVSDTLVSVLRDEPDWTALPASTPPLIRRLLRRCLEKDRKRRFDSAADARMEIEDAMIAPSPADAATLSPAPGSHSSHALPWALAAVFGIVAILGWTPWRSAVPPHVTRTTIVTSGTTALTITGFDRDFAISPDGGRLVYVGNGATQLFVRAFDALEPVAIVSADRVTAPFVSPDGEWVGFTVGGSTLQKVKITGGSTITLARLDASTRGATWAADDTIIFATGTPATGLQRVSAAGGIPEVLTRPDQARGEADHLWPELLPNGRGLLFTITSQIGGLDTAELVVRDLRTGTNKVLLRGGSHAHYVASGHLVYVAAGTLRAIPFDANRLETQGTAVPVLSRLVTTSTGSGDFSITTDGTLVYVDPDPSRGLTANARTLVWVDRTGKEESTGAPPHAYLHPRLSPDGKRVAFWSADQDDDIWIWDLRRKIVRRLTLDASQDRFPVWTPDGRRVIFTSNRSGAHNLWWQAADGTGSAARLTTSNSAQFPTGITPDGATVVFNETTPTMGNELRQLALNGTREVKPLLQTKFDEYNADVSPDGRWLTYDSNRSGSFEVYVRPFPNVDDGEWQVSTAGGAKPLWARNAKELFYVGADGALLRVPVEASDATWNAGAPVKLFDGRYVNTGTSGRTYDVSHDGQRFLMIKAPAIDASTAVLGLIVVQHWDEELKRVVRVK